MRSLRRMPVTLALGAAIAALTGLGGPPGGPAGAQQATPISVQPTPTTVVPTATPRPGTTPVPSTPVPGATATPRPPGATPGAAPAPQTGPVSARITYPPTGQIIALQPMLVLLDIGGIRLDAGLIGAASAPGVGHWLILVDGVEVAAGDAREVYMSGLPPGSHELTIQVRNNDRSPLVPPVGSSILICVEVCSEEPVEPVLPEVPAGLPRTGSGGLLGAPH